MKVEKLPSGSYRVRKQINKKNVQVTFDHKPTESEIIAELSKHMTLPVCDLTFTAAATDYIRMKKNVLSPSTIRSYNMLAKGLSSEFSDKKIENITQVDVQREINRIAADHSAKTVYNYHGFISAVLTTFLPNTVLHTTLPPKRQNDPYIPSAEDVRKIIEYSKEKSHGDFYVPIMLACYGLRRSEICALTPDKINGNIITIDSAVVRNENNEWVKKDMPKTASSIRQIPVSQEIIDRIMAQGYVFNHHPNEITNFLAIACNKLGIPRFSVHKLRHYFCSQLSANNVDPETILYFGGWKTDYVMKKTYRHAVLEKKQDLEKKLNSVLFQNPSHDNS